MLNEDIIESYFHSVDKIMCMETVLAVCCSVKLIQIIIYFKQHSRKMAFNILIRKKYKDTYLIYTVNIVAYAQIS